MPLTQRRAFGPVGMLPSAAEGEVAVGGHARADRADRVLELVLPRAVADLGDGSSPAIRSIIAASSSSLPAKWA